MLLVDRSTVYKYTPYESTSNYMCQSPSHWNGPVAPKNGGTFVKVRPSAKSLFTLWFKLLNKIAFVLGLYYFKPVYSSTLDYLLVCHIPA